jgi:hypothetical protein
LWARNAVPSREGSWVNSFRLWISLNAVDAIVTSLCLSLGMSEANPFLRIAAVTHGTAPMLGLKMLLALLIGVLVWKRGSRRMRTALNIGMALILIANCILVCKPLWSMNA